MGTHTTPRQRIGARIYDPFLWFGGAPLHGSAPPRPARSRGGSRAPDRAGTGSIRATTGDSIEALVTHRAGRADGRQAPAACRAASCLGARSPGAGRGAAVRRPLVRHGRLDNGALHCRRPCPIAERDCTRSAAGRQLLFIEHLRRYRAWGRWQDRLERPWASFGCGCRCNRRTLELIAQSPLRVEASARASWRGMPPLVRPLTIGSATA